MFKKRNKNALSAGLIAWLLMSGVRLVAAPLEDPTQPPGFIGTSGAGSKQSQLPAWQVSSILISKDRRLAIINGESVRQGDLVDSARVIRISPTAVILRNSAETFTVKLLPTQIKSVREK